MNVTLTKVTLAYGLAILVKKVKKVKITRYQKRMTVKGGVRNHFYEITSMEPEITSKN